jgi:hypothetical protein
MNHVGAVQRLGGLHSMRVGPHHPSGRENGNKYKKKSKLVALSLPNCQLYQCNPPLLVTDNPHTMTIEPSILRHYGLGAGVSGRGITTMSPPDK